MTMKTRLPYLLALALATSVAGVSFSGCASTATRESTGEFFDDSVITAKVKTALAADKVVNAFAVNVETFKGVVQLSGFVDTEAQRTQAEAVAGRVLGVKSVQNNISLKASTT